MLFVLCSLALKTIRDVLSQQYHSEKLGYLLQGQIKTLKVVSPLHTHLLKCAISGNHSCDLCLSSPLERLCHIFCHVFLIIPIKEDDCGITVTTEGLVS